MGILVLDQLAEANGIFLKLSFHRAFGDRLRVLVALGRLYLFGLGALFVNSNILIALFQLFTNLSSTADEGLSQETELTVLFAQVYPPVALNLSLPALSFSFIFVGTLSFGLFVCLLAALDLLWNLGHYLFRGVEFNNIFIIFRHEEFSPVLLGKTNLEV